MTDTKRAQLLIQFLDEIARTRGRVTSVFAEGRTAIGLSDLEMIVLNAVFGAGSPPTVPQIGRSLGHARQVIQRAANTLVDKGLKTAWIIDTQPHGAARTHIAMCKVEMVKIHHDIVRRAIQIHGSYGVTNETPLASMWEGLLSLGLADGPTEVHKVQVAKAFLKQAQPYEGLFPPEHIPTRLEAVKARYSDILEEPMSVEAAQ
jgi:alkylation response protein AidB-like acyl-CoA dehydrogenase